MAGAGADELEKWESDEQTWDSHIEAQQARLPAGLLLADRLTIKATELAVVAIGALFTFLIAYDVVSRYVFDASSFFVSAAARFLLFWFFMLGAGLALRKGAHVGFDMLVNSLRPPLQRGVRVTAQLLMLVFFLQMLWSGLASLEAATKQIDPALQVSLFWSFLAIPIGFALLIYHLLVLMLLDRRSSVAQEPSA